MSHFLSGDADGHVFLWDYRMAKEQANTKVSEHDLNKVEFERNGKSFLVASDDKTVKMYSDELECKKTLTGHEDCVLDVVYD